MTTRFCVHPWVASVTGVIAALSVTSRAFVLISVDEELTWGREAQAAMRKEARLVADPAIGQYVTRVGRRLAAHVGGPK